MAEEVKAEVKEETKKKTKKYLTVNTDNKTITIDPKIKDKEQIKEAEAIIKFYLQAGYKLRTKSATRSQQATAKATKYTKEEIEAKIEGN